MKYGAALIRLAFLAGLAALVAAGCAVSPDDRSDKYPRSGKSYVINGKRYYTLASAKGYSEQGTASWYGKKFHGRKTASGERYDMYKLTAAHKTLPMGTWVKVTHLTNGRSINVKVNDRGPFARGRILDLSYAGAKKLGMLGSGTAPVRVTALGKTSDRKVAGKWQKVLIQPASYKTGRFAVQIGAFSEKNRAYDLADRMKREFGAATVQLYESDKGTFYRVQVADVTSVSKAEAVQGKLEGMGFRDCFVVAR